MKPFFRENRKIEKYEIVLGEKIMLLWFDGVFVSVLETVPTTPIIARTENVVTDHELYFGDRFLITQTQTSNRQVKNSKK